MIGERRAVFHDPDVIRDVRAGDMTEETTRFDLSTGLEPPSQYVRNRVIDVPDTRIQPEMRELVRPVQREKLPAVRDRLPNRITVSIRDVGAEVAELEPSGQAAVLDVRVSGNQEIGRVERIGHPGLPQQGEDSGMYPELDGRLPWLIQFHVERLERPADLAFQPVLIQVCEEAQSRLARIGPEWLEQALTRNEPPDCAVAALGRGEDQESDAAHDQSMVRQSSSRNTCAVRPDGFPFARE